MIEAEQYGEGPPLVLIHGSPSNAQAWKQVGQRLVDRFRIIAPTLPGHEPSPGPLRPTETADMAEAVETLLAGIDGPLRIAGHSYGGNVALQIALRRVVPVDHLILLEPVLMGVLPAVGEGALFAEAKALFDRYIAAVETGEPGAVTIMVDYMFGPGALGRMPPPMQAYLAAQAPVNARDVAATFRERHAPAPLAALDCPTTVAFGGASPVLLQTIARRLAETMTDGAAVEIAGAGHAMLASHPAQVAAAIADFAGD